jgi:hypothetical protein
MTGATAGRGIEAWLATPDAADRMDPARLSDTERGAWGALRTERRRRDWASGRALLAAAAVGQDQNSSLSHSRSHAALAVASRGVAVGIDIECLVPRDFLGMAEMAYAASEFAELRALADPQARCAAFYELWTLKEAFAKALQLPLVDALRLCRCDTVSSGQGAEVPTPLCWRATIFAPRPELRLSLVCTARTADLLATSFSTLEWPRPRTTDWRIVRRLAGGGERAC